MHTVNFNLHGTETGRYSSKIMPIADPMQRLRMEDLVTGQVVFIPDEETFIGRLKIESARLSEERAKSQCKSWVAMVKRCKMEGMWHIAEVAALHFCVKV